MNGLNLGQAFAVLMFFYIVGAVVQIVSGEPIATFQLPEIRVEPADRGLLSLIITGIASAFGGIIDLVNAFLQLITLPLSVISAVDFGVFELNVAVKSLLFIVLGYVYFVVLSGIKDIISPFR